MVCAGAPWHVFRAKACQICFWPFDLARKGMEANKAGANRQTNKGDLRGERGENCVVAHGCDVTSYRQRHGGWGAWCSTPGACVVWNKYNKNTTKEIV
jgi:hypothetical protein